MPLGMRSRTLTSALALVALGTLCAGCASNQTFATLSSGACSAFPRPQYQIKGATSYDQRWADETTEAGVAGCRWKRPSVRPQSLDPAPNPVAVKKQTFKQRWLSLHFRQHAVQSK